MLKEGGEVQADLEPPDQTGGVDKKEGREAKGNRP